MSYGNLNSYVIEHLPDGRCAAYEIQLTGLRVKIADFESPETAAEWVAWKQGIPRINPYCKGEGP
jgi:hypothetical protein